MNGAAYLGQGEGAEVHAPRSGARTPPLPCLNRNNSNETAPVLTPGARRTAFALAENVRLLANEFGLERLGFLTLTFVDHVTSIREAQRRFNSLRSGVLAERYAASIAVVERMKSGRIHFHLLVVLDEDIRTGFDFEAVARHDYRTANAYLRAEWAAWRTRRSGGKEVPGIAAKYGFGRTELLPVKSTAEGIATYVGKYIAKHIDARKEEDRGARLVRYTRSARKCTTRFSWAGPRGWLWRAKLAQFAARHGIIGAGGMKQTFGARWAWQLAETIAAETLTEYPSTAHARADGHDLPEEWEGWGKVTIRGGGLVPGLPVLGAVIREVDAPGEVVRKRAGGWGLKQPPVRAKPVEPPETTWERIRGAVERGEVVKLSPFVAIVPGGAALGVD